MAPKDGRFSALLVNKLVVNHSKFIRVKFEMHAWPERVVPVLVVRRPIDVATHESNRNEASHVETLPIENIPKHGLLHGKGSRK